MLTHENSESETENLIGNSANSSENNGNENNEIYNVRSK